MKHTAYFRLLPCVLLAVASPLLGHCGRVNDSTGITETGNPPVINQQKLHILVRSAGVQVVGGPGAITSSATIVVTNLTSGDSANGTASEDGSVTIDLSGSLQDLYEIAVTTGNGSKTSRLSADSNGALIDIGELTCDGLSSTATERALQALNRATQTCTSDADCTLVTHRMRCVADCGEPVGSATAATADALRGAVLAVETTFCGEFEQRPCEGPAVIPCGPSQAGVTSRAICVAGLCDVESFRLP